MKLLTDKYLFKSNSMINLKDKNRREDAWDLLSILNDKDKLIKMQIIWKWKALMQQ